MATVAGALLRIGGRNGLRINDARVLCPDIEVSNGVIHVIGKVLTPAPLPRPGTAAPTAK